MIGRALIALALLASPATAASFAGIANDYINKVDDAPGFCHPSVNCWGSTAAWGYCTLFEFDDLVVERSIGAKWGGPSSDRQIRFTITAAGLEIAMGSSATDWDGATLTANTWYAMCATADGLDTTTSGRVWVLDIAARPMVFLDNAGVWPADADAGSPDGPLTIGGRQGSDPMLGHQGYSVYTRSFLTEADVYLFALRPRAFCARHNTAWCMGFYDGGTPPNWSANAGTFTEVGTGSVSTGDRAPTGMN